MDNKDMRRLWDIMSQKQKDIFEADCPDWVQYELLIKAEDILEQNRYSGIAKQVAPQAHQVAQVLGEIGEPYSVVYSVAQDEYFCDCFDHKTGDTTCAHILAHELYCEVQQLSENDEIIPF